MVYLNTHNQTRTIVGRITDLPTYKPDYAGMQIPESQKDNTLESGIYKIVKSPCSRYVIIQMSQSYFMHCYSLHPTFEPDFEVFAFKLYEYKPLNTPNNPINNNPLAGIAWFPNQVPMISNISYQFTPSGNFIYFMYETTLHKLDTLTGCEIYKGQFWNVKFNQLIPLDDTMICGQYMKGYYRATHDNNPPVWALAETEQKLYFKLGRVLASGIEWLDTLEVLADDPWLLPATNGQLFRDADKIKIMSVLDRNTLYFTHESQISWSVLALPIDMLANKFGRGYMVYQHPATDRDTLCPVLKYVHVGKLYGVIMNDANFQIVSLCLNSGKVNKINKLEVLAAGHHFNLPYKEKWDHSERIREISFIDDPVVVNKPNQLFKKITDIDNAPQLEPTQDISPFINIIEYGHYSHNEIKDTIKKIDFTPDMYCVFVYYSRIVYVYKAKFTYKEVDAIVNNMDAKLADLGIVMPIEILTDIACTVAVPKAQLSVSDMHKIHNTTELEAKLAERMQELHNDPEIKIEKQSNIDFLIYTSTRSIKLPNVNNIIYNTNSNVNYNNTNSGIMLFGTLE